ncbi:MAG: type II toxin-antitoxin system RelE/ParE family toxin [Deltaproteobacteria bacterium]|nr:MAG: type II toxin-antitoxin system RelE/ParE family toxin [Deltaproteobacteria bacterium]
MNDIEWKKKAFKQLKRIPKSSQVAIVDSVDMLEQPQELWRNVKSLTNHQHDYRLRVGRYRVFFNYDGGVEVVSIEEIKKRDERTY